MTTKSGKLPGRYLQFQEAHPQIFQAYEQLGKAATVAGPLNQKEIALVKLALAAGARLEGAVHSHCRRALEAGLTKEEIRHAVLLSVTTMGFPSMMATLSWVDDIIEESNAPRK
jgi:alkylhydroperoxidase/carboxymuconolactone decarboxylase family protein YurZ